MPMEEVLDSRLEEGDIVHLGPVTPFSFPDPVTDERFPGWAVAHAALREECRKAVAWLDGVECDAERRRVLGLDAVAHGGILDPVGLSLFVAGAALVPDDGRDEPEQARGFAELGPDVLTLNPAVAQIASAVSNNGGLLLRQVHSLTPGLRQLHHDLVAAHHEQVELLLCVGSVSTGKLLRPTTRTVVIALGPGCVARSRSVAPLPLEPGEVAHFPEPVRTIGGPSARCLVIALDPPCAFDQRKFLLRRATCHPLLRLDVPIAADDVQELYGVEPSVPYLSAFEREVASVLEHTTSSTFDAWWASRLTSVIPPPVTRSDRLQARGRFVGGVGILAETERGAIVAAGGETFAVSRAAVRSFTRFVAGERLELSDPLEAEIFSQLVPRSLAELVPRAADER